jgi:hypothetical protein
MVLRVVWPQKLARIIQLPGIVSIGQLSSAMVWLEHDGAFSVVVFTIDRWPLYM